MKKPGEVPLMITRHCIRYSLSLCPKQAKGVIGVQGQVRAEPMTLVNGSEHLTLQFDCRSLRDARDGQDEETHPEDRAALDCAGHVSSAAT